MDTVTLVGWPSAGYSIGKPINKKMQFGQEVCQRDPRRFNDAAYMEWWNGVSLLRNLGEDVLNGLPQYGGGDAVFFRDIGGWIGGCFVLSKFAHEDRRPETKNIWRLLSQKYVFEFEDERATFEGGDCVWTPFKNIFALGVSSRTNIHAHNELKRRLAGEVEILSLQLIGAHHNGHEHRLQEDEYFHADRAAFYLPSGDLVIYRDAFTESSWRAAENLARKHGRSVYNLSLEEACAGAANIKILSSGDLLTTDKISESLDNWLQSKVSKLHKQPCEAFDLSGGGWHCLTLEVPRHMLTDQARDMLAEQQPQAAPFVPEAKAAHM